LLIDLEDQEFNVDVDELHIGSHKKVHVRCTRCLEEFTREYRHKHQLHVCPTHTTRSDGVKLKWCNKCSSFLTITSFNNSAARYDGLNSYCKTCFNQSLSSKNNNNVKRNSRKTIEGWLKNYTLAKSSKCKKQGIQN
jgi:hypothetical protein